MPPSSPFTPEQETWIVTTFPQLNSLTAVKRKFRIVFKLIPKQVPCEKSFKRVVDRFSLTGSVHHQKPAGRPVSQICEENIARVKEMVEEDNTISIRYMVDHLNLSYGTIWTIMRKKLDLFPYKPKTVQPLTKEHRRQRVKFCDWLLQKNDENSEFVKHVIWSDEKLWEEKVNPNRQNERYWGEVDPEVEIDCRQQGNKKVMCWARVINGQILLHWFPLNTTVNQQVYLDLLETILWPAVRSVSTRREYWFQQDGATCHTTVMVRNWLHSKFGTRVISRHTETPWPARSPDLSCLDYWFWSVCLAELRRSPPSSLEELQNTVTEYTSSLDREEVIRASKDIIVRAKVCKAAQGGPFEYKLKKSKKVLDNEE